MAISRRQFILASSAAAAVGLAGYSYRRGLRLPPLHWEPKLVVPDLGSLKHQENHLLLLPTATKAISSWRATAPEPRLVLNNPADLQTTLEIQNLSPRVILIVDGADHEEHINGSRRQIKLNLHAEKSATLTWKLAAPESAIKFAAIGDSGGDLELAWCIQRASQLGADFLLHLGDFNYQDGDYQRAIDNFNSSEIPVYVSIGNHDFHDNGGVYGRFLSEIGPLNQAFEVSGNRFINIDTAAGFLPISGGQRGQLFSALRQQKVINTVAFSHRPLIDPDRETHHDIGSAKERAWLIKQMRSIGVSSLLCGHIHINDRRTIAGIDQIIVGQGLGHQDLIVGKDHSKIAIGKINRQGTFEIELDDLAMPMELHCHPRSRVVKQSLLGGQHETLIRSIDQACNLRSA